MKIIKSIIYDGAPQEAENGLIAKVRILVGEESETDPLFYATFNHVCIIPFSSQCISVGDAINVIKLNVLQSCETFVLNNFNK